MNEVDNVVRNDEMYYVQPGDPEYNAEYARLVEGQEISYIRPEIQDALENFEKEYRDISEQGNRVNLNLRDFEEARLSSALVDLDEATGGIILNNIEFTQPFVYDVVDNQAGYRDLRSELSFDQAVEIARDRIESEPTDPSGGSTKFIGTTYPTADGGDPKNYREFRLLPPENDPRFATIDMTQHFERDTFAHFRSTDRKIRRENGNDVNAMFVEEMQSDYVQGGQRAGFKPKTLPVLRLKTKYRNCKIDLLKPIAITFLIGLSSLSKKLIFKI